MALDSSGRVGVVGETESSNFPLVNAYDSSYGGGGTDDVFVTQLAADGSVLRYSSFLGGSGDDEATGVVVDSSDNLVLTGRAASGYPTKNAYDSTYNGGSYDMIITRVDPGASGSSSLLYSTFLGAGSNERGYAIATGGGSTVYVVGSTYNSGFPTKNAYDSSHNGGADVVVVALDPALSGSASLRYSTFLGGSSSEEGLGIAADSSGNAYVTGYASSGFPLVHAAQTTYGGNKDAFVAVLNTTVSGNAGLTYSTLLGGAQEDRGTAIVQDGAGTISLTGWTRSDNYPTAQPTQAGRGGDDCASAPCADAVVTQLDTTAPVAAQLSFSTYLGDAQEEQGRGIARGSDGGLYVAGVSFASAPTGSQSDAFVATFAASTAPVTPIRPPVANDVPAAPGTARAALLDAIQIVEGLDYTGPPASDSTCTTDAILQTLRSSVDGTFLSDNFLADDRAYDRMRDSVTCLQAVINDSQVAADVKAQAQQARDLVLSAARAIPVQTLSATALFGETLPDAINDQIAQAQQTIANGDSQVRASAFNGAIDSYQIAWTTVKSLGDQLWATYDPDGDFLLDQFEATLGTSTTSADSDGDGISDGDEVTLTGTDPTVADSASDLDGDTLTASAELAAGTNPLRADSDGDTLDDRFELQDFGSDPRRVDTDADGLTDDSEFRLGTDPRNADSDGDGTPDGAESYTSVATSTNGAVAVDITGTGDVAGTVQFQTLISNTLFQAMPGQIGTAVDITAEVPFTQARVQIRFDPMEVPNGDVANLRILYFDEDDNVFKPTDGAYGVDASTGVAWAETSHFTTFVLFYIPNWNAVWTYDMEPGRSSTGPITASLDVMLVIDESGSMTSNDPENLRVTGAKNFVDALIEGDLAGAVGFATNGRLLQPLTTVTPTVKSALDSVLSTGGGTCIATGLVQAISQLTSTGTTDHLRMIVLLTDGGDTTCVGRPNYAALAAQAAAADIQVYTIGLIRSTGVDEQLLTQLATQTGGQYYAVTEAADLPEVFRRIAEGPDPTLDTDGDGLPDWLETQGIRRGNGSIVTTDPATADTDGDGLSDGDEVGTRRTGPDGDYYDGITDPTKADTDGDGFLDSVELEIGTNPTNADTDGDGLNDYTEMSASFDPTDANPDGDAFGDAEELARGSDPFTYDLSGWEYAGAVVAGFTLGDAGQNMVDAGLLNPVYLQSFGYIGGWLASGFFGIGDIRDTLATLVRGDVANTFLNAIGLIPLLGDSSKVVRVVAKYVEWLPEARLALRGWIRKQFANAPEIIDDVLQALVRQCLGNSFSANTLVTTKHGLQPISTVASGNQVLGYYEPTGITGLFTVTTTMRHTDPQQVYLTISGEPIETTPEHPFFTQERGWVDAGDLWIGANIRQARGAYGTVQTMRLEHEPQVMYNLTVAEAHTFFVGTQQWLVHNASFCEIFPNQLANRLNDEISLALRLGVKPIKGTGPDFAAAVNEGTIKWAVTETGELVIIPKFVNNQEISHAVLTNGKPVLAAGEAEIVGSGGQFIGLSINNNSGHYKPSLESLEVGKDAFQLLGISFN